MNQVHLGGSSRQNSPTYDGFGKSVMVAIKPTEDWGSPPNPEPLYCQTDDVAELRHSVAMLDPEATVTVIKPVSPIFVVGYLAEISRGQAPAAESATLRVVTEREAKA